MKRSSKKIKCFVLIVLIMLLAFLSPMITEVKAIISNDPTTDPRLKGITGVETFVNKQDSKSMDMQKVIEAYENLSENYTNEELANMVEENKEILTKYGVSQSNIDTGIQVLKTMDEDQLKKILKEDINIDEVMQQLKQGDSVEKVIKDIQKNLTTQEKIKIGLQLLLANFWVKAILVIAAVYAIYSLILRWILFIKAGKHGWAAIIPVYRDIVWLQMCGLSPWLLLFVFLPIIGWFVLFIVAIMDRFELAKVFGKGTAFGFGLLLFDVIFKSILAFNPNIHYVGIEEE